MKRALGLLRLIAFAGVIAVIGGCGGSSGQFAPDTVALVSVSANSNSPTTPPTSVVATFNVKVVSLAANFFQITGSCTSLPTSTASFDSSGKIVTETLSGGNCTAGQTLTLKLDPAGAAFATPVGSSGSVWTRTYTIAGTEQSVGGTITGLIGNLVLQNNGGAALTIGTDGNFIFPSLVAQGSPYQVSVQTQPAGQTCSVSNGSGTMGTTAIQNVAVICSTNSFTVGGTVSGLAGTLVLQNNGAGSVQTISADGPFTFSPAVAEGSPYAVTVQTQPAGQTCTVNNGSALMGGANVTNVTVICSINAFTVGGTVSGLSGTAVLQNNGTDSLVLSSNGSFTFPTPIAEGSTYNVTVLTQPATQTCTVTNGSGTVGGSNVTNVAITCSANTTTLSVSPTGTIPVNGVAGTLTVTNTGVQTAFNVSAVLPGGWSGVTQDASSCTAVAPGDTCTLSFNSSAPYVAQGNIVVTGDNVSTPPTTALAFTIQGYPVFSVVTASTAVVVDTVDASSSVAWGPTGSTTNCQSFTDGATNTPCIVTALGTPPITAASACASSTAGGATAGTWYLPAICEIDSTATFSCAGAANIESNLVELGFGGFQSGSDYWSSTEEPSNSTSVAWSENFSTNPAVSDIFFKNRASRARCVRSISY